MADIRLKTLTIDNILNNKILTVQGGDINITNTTIAIDILSGALVINGGISINCTYECISSTSGCALTVGGGLGVHKKAILGSDLILDSNNSVLNIGGISKSRMYMDTVNNKNFYISVDGINKRLDLLDTNLTINITRESINGSTGGLVINGGLSINCSFDSSDSSKGGALTVNGGLAISGNSYLSKTLIIGQLYGNNDGLLVRYTGNNQIALQNSNGNSVSTLNMNGDKLEISNKSDINFITSSGNIIYSNLMNNLLIINSEMNCSTFVKYVNIIDTIESINSTTASLIVKGGISVKCTRDAESITNGGSITISGGLGVNKKIYTGDSIGINLDNNNKNNKLMLYQLNADLTKTIEFTGLGITNGSLQFNLSDITNKYVFTTNSTELFIIKGNSEVQFVGNNQYYSVIGGGNTNNDLSFQSQNIASDSSINYYTKDGDSNDNNDIKIYGVGIPNNVVNSEYLKMGWDKRNYIISTNKTGNGNNQNIIIQTNTNVEQLKLQNNGTIVITSTTQSICSTIGGLVLLSGGLSINGTNDAVSLTEGGGLTLNGGMSVKKSINVGNSIKIYSTGGNINLYSQDTNGSLLISNPTNIFTLSGNEITKKYSSNLGMYSLNNTTIGNYELLLINTSNTNSNSIYNINSNANGNGVLHPLQINVGSNSGLYLDINGNIGINTTVVNYQLDINGTIRGNSLNNFNQLTIYNTSPATTLNSSGSLTVFGGVSISKNMYIGGEVNFSNTIESSSTSASVYISGGLTVAKNQISNYGSGALTVIGGGSIGGDLYIGKSVYVSGNLEGSASSSTIFAYMTITSTDEAKNLTSGSLVTFGGMTIQGESNAQNVSNGGGLLVAGGASIQKDIYIGGDMYNYGVTNYYEGVNNLINMYSVSNIIKFSIDRDITLNDMSITRYNNSGEFIEKSINISNINGIITLNNTMSSNNVSSGSLIIKGGITIINTINSVNCSNGGCLTVYGGVGICKDLYVNGIVNFINTTDSTSNNNGGLVINTGVGITGNVNILGNTVITGNLTINGTVNSISSTNTLIADNILVLNSGPLGTADSGFIVQRYQIDNDIGRGDVVNDKSNTEKTFGLPSQSGLSSIQLKLPITSSLVDNYYNNWWIKITSGFSVNQVRKVIGYSGSTHIITIDSNWSIQNASLGDTVSIYSRPYVGLIWNERYDRFELGSLVEDPGKAQVIFSESANLQANEIVLVSSIGSSNSTTGALIISGGLSINSTYDATSITQGGDLTISGGASIAKTLYVGTAINVNGVNIKPNTLDIPSTIIYNGSNNVINSNISGLNFDNSVWGVDIFISIRLVSTVNLYSNYQLRCTNRNNSWDLGQVYIGDKIIEFSITTSGQIQYTCQNYSGFSSLIFKFKAITN